MSWEDIPLIESTAAQPIAPVTPAGEFVVPGEEPPSPYVLASEKSDFVLPSDLNPVNVPNGFNAFTSDQVTSSEFTDTYENADGTNTLFTSAIPMNAKDDSGTWVPISTSPVSDGRGGEVVEDHPLNPKFAADASSENAFSVSRDGFDLAFSPIDADSSRLGSEDASVEAPSDTTVEYADVFGDVDVTYDVTRGAVKETLVLDKAPKLGEATWSWRVRAPGLAVLEDETGNFLLNDATGQTRFVIPDPIMWDSSGKLGVSEPDTRNVDASVRADGSDWVFTLAADEAWLHSTDRVYPVSVDPTSVGAYTSNVHSYKSDGTHIADGQARIGNARSAGDAYWRTAMHYDYEQVFGKQVLDVWIDGAYNGAGTENLHTGTVYHLATYAYGGAGLRLSNFPVGTTGRAADYAIPRCQSGRQSNQRHELLPRGRRDPRRLHLQDPQYGDGNHVQKLSDRRSPGLPVTGERCPEPADA